MTNALLEIENLEIDGQLSSEKRLPIVKRVSLKIERGEVVALIGESGAGKSTIALASLGYTRSGCRVTSGHVWFDGADLLTLGKDERRKIRGRRVAYIAQSASAAFNASITIGSQVIEGPLVHGTMRRKHAERQAIELYKRLRLPGPESIGAKYPHQVSGGQLQRLMAAMALMCGPDLLVLDEPTTAIDVTTQVEVLSALKDVIRQEGAAAIYVTHDLAVVAQIADRVVVLRHGEVVEEGAVEDVLHNPREEYTKQLVAAARPMPAMGARSAERAADGNDRDLVLEVKSIVAGYGGRAGKPLVLPVLRHVSLDVPRGGVVALIGESGCGKSTLARVIAGLLPATSGELRLDGQALPLSLRARDRASIRKIQIVFQMSDVSFNPSRTIGSSLSRPLELFLGMDPGQCRTQIANLLEMIELPPEFAERYPSELSGGQRQRVNLARALAAEPSVVICDEVTSAVDTVISASMIRLLKKLQKHNNQAYIFISHDLSTAASFADRIAVLYAGRVVEEGPTTAVLNPPSHPYTKMLLASVPELKRGWLERVSGIGSSATGGQQNSTASQEGCAFYSRCSVRIAGLCDRCEPPVRIRAGDHRIACHRTLEELGAS